MSRILITFLLFGLPLVVLPFGISPFEIPKVILAQIAIELLVFNTILKRQKLGDFDFKGLIALSLIGLLGLIHTIFLRENTTLFGNAFRMQGVFLIFHLLAFALISRDFTVQSIPKNIVPYAVSAIFLGAFIFGTDNNGRFIGTLGEPNALAAQSVFLAPFVYFSRQKKFIKIILLSILIFLVLLSGSRSAFLALIIEAIFLILASRLNILKASIICFAILIASHLLPLVEGSRVFENRAEIWQTAWHAGFNKPILGNGFGNVEGALKKTSQRLSSNIQYQYVDSSHNLFLDWWIQGGLIGVLTLVFLIRASFLNFVSSSKVLELSILLGLLTVSAFNPQSISSLIGLFWLFGQGLKKAKSGFLNTL